MNNTAANKHIRHNANPGQGIVEFSGALVMATLSVMGFGVGGGWATGQLIINHTMETVNALLVVVG